MTRIPGAPAEIPDYPHVLYIKGDTEASRPVVFQSWEHAKRRRADGLQPARRRASRAGSNSVISGWHRDRHRGTVKRLRPVPTVAVVANRCPALRLPADVARHPRPRRGFSHGTALAVRSERQFTARNPHHCGAESPGYIAKSPTAACSSGPLRRRFTTGR